MSVLCDVCDESRIHVQPISNKTMCSVLSLRSRQICQMYAEAVFV